MPTTSARCRKMLVDDVAEKKWSKEGVFYIQMLISVGERTQDIALAIDPGSKFDGYVIAGTQEVILQGMAILPSRVCERMETRRMLRHNRRSRNTRRRKARFYNRKSKTGWIAPSQLAKVQLRIRLMERLCQLFPVNDIIIEDVRFNHYKKRWGKNFSTVEIGKTKVYEAAKRLAVLWLPQGWETAQAREDYNIKKCSQKSRLAPESHAHDAWAMCCWLFGERPENVLTKLYVWRRQEQNRRQLHVQNPTKGNKRKRVGGTTYSNSKLRKGDIISYCNQVIGYMGGWTHNGNTISLTGSDGKRVRQAAISKIKLLSRSPNILTNWIIC